jgi:hypothetical protein
LRVCTRRRRQVHPEPGPRDEIRAPPRGRQADHHAKSLEPELARPSVLDHAAEAGRAALLGDQPVIIPIVYPLVWRPMRTTFWTLSAWTDRDASDAFVRTMPHLVVMGKLRTHMGPARFTTWMAPGSALPIAWDAALERLMRASTPEGPASP